MVHSLSLVFHVSSFRNELPFSLRCSRLSYFASLLFSLHSRSLFFPFFFRFPIFCLCSVFLYTHRFSRSTSFKNDSLKPVRITPVLPSLSPFSPSPPLSLLLPLSLTIWLALFLFSGQFPPSSVTHLGLPVVPTFPRFPRSKQSSNSSLMLRNYRYVDEESLSG